MKYGRTGCAVVRGNGDVRKGRIVPRLETRCWQKAKTLKGVLEEKAIYSYQKNLKKMEEEVKGNIANEMLSFPLSC
jgi:hypothetical protein